MSTISTLTFQSLLQQMLKEPDKRWTIRDIGLAVLDASIASKADELRFVAYDLLDKVNRKHRINLDGGEDVDVWFIKRKVARRNATLLDDVTCYWVERITHESPRPVETHEFEHDGDGYYIQWMPNIKKPGLIAILYACDRDWPLAEYDEEEPGCDRQVVVSYFEGWLSGYNRGVLDGRAAGGEAARTKIRTGIKELLGL